MADLYQVEVAANGGSSPTRSGGGAPAGIDSRNIGGSDVGQDSMGDQRIRDLIRQNEPQMEEFIASVVTKSSGGGSPFAEFYNSDNVVLIFGSPAAGVGATITGSNHIVAFPGGPVRLNIAARFSIDYLPFVPPLPFTGVVEMFMKLFMDGVYIWAGHVELALRMKIAADEILGTVQLNTVVVMEPGKKLDTVFGLTTEAAMTAALSSGTHTVRVDIQFFNSDDSFLDLQMWDEYFSFTSADATKITSLQLFDATTIL